MASELAKSNKVDTGLQPFGQLSQDDVYIPKDSDGTSTAPELTAQAVVNLVVHDYNAAVQFINTTEWYGNWRDNDILYQSPLVYDPANPGKARVSRFTVNNDANTLADAVKSGMFAQNPPYFLRKRGKTTADQLKAWSALLEVLTGRMKLQYWVGLAIQSQTLQGTGICRLGWSTRTRTVLKRKQKAPPVKTEMPTGNTETVHTKDSDQHETTPVKITESYPWIDFRKLGTTLFDPKWSTPNAPEYAGYVIDIDYPTWSDLKEWSKSQDYTIPDLEKLREWLMFRGKQSAEQGTSVDAGTSQSGSPVMHAVGRNEATSADPTKWPILMLTWWDESRVHSVLHINGRYVVIQNREHGLGRVPHFTANWRNIENSGYGIGIGRLVGADQRLEQGVLNHALNLLSYQMNPAILYALGSGNAPTGDRMVRAGGFMGVGGDDVRKALTVMEMPAVPGEAWQMIQYSQQSSQATSGADSTFMGGNLGAKGSSAARTATGAGRIASKSDARVQTPVENVEMGIMVPAITMLITLVKIYMPLSEIRQVLIPKLGDELAEQIVNEEFLEAEFEAEVLAGAKLSAKAAMAQQLPYLMQLFQQPQLLEQLHQRGDTVDLQVILDILFAVSEYKQEDQIIRPMNNKEKALYQQAQQLQAGGGPKQQTPLDVEKQRGQNELEVEQERGKNELAKTAVQHVLQDHAGKTPLDRATGLVDRGNDEQQLLGNAPSPLGEAY